MGSKPFLRLVCASVALLGAATNAGADGVTVFDVPSGGGNKTSGFAISHNGLVVGQSVGASNVTFGFERLANGTIVYPIQAPGDNSNFTRTLGVNSAGTIVGDYLNTVGSSSTFHGNLLNGSTFTQYDV